MIENITVGRVLITKVTEEGRTYCEATCDNCTGHGSTMVEAFLDLRSKVKKEMVIKNIVMRYNYD